jgi:hypothetical protein
MCPDGVECIVAYRYVAKSSVDFPTLRCNIFQNENTSQPNELIDRGENLGGESHAIKKGPMYVENR